MLVALTTVFDKGAWALTDGPYTDFILPPISHV